MELKHYRHYCEDIENVENYTTKLLYGKLH